MKVIKFIRLELNDFQGVEKLEFDFGEAVTSIEGKNGVGKSTILDSILWAITGKNTKDMSDTNFKITPLDKDNNVLVESKTSVRLTINDGEKDHVLERKIVLKYKRLENGEVDRQKGVGKTTQYSIDGIELKQGQYNGKVLDLIGDLDTFKLLTNPNHFLLNKKEKEQRSLLLSYITPVSHKDLVSIDERYSELTELEDLPFEQVLTSVRKNHTDTSKEIDDKRSEKKGMKSSLLSINEDNETDFSVKENERDTLKETIKDMRNSNSNNITKQTTINTLTRERDALQFKIDNAESNFNRERQSLITDLNNKINYQKTLFDASVVKLSGYRDDLNALKVKSENVAAVVKENADAVLKQFVDNQKEMFASIETSVDEKIEDYAKQIEELSEINIDETCVVCGSELPGEKVKEQLQSITDRKIELEALINSQKEYLKGKEDAMNLTIANKQKQINNDLEVQTDKTLAEINNDIAKNIATGKAENTLKKEYAAKKLELETKLEALKLKVFDPSSVGELNTQLSAKNKEIEALGTTTLYSQEEIQNLQDKVDRLVSELSSQDNIGKINEQIEKLDANIELKVEALSKLEFKKLLLEDYLQTKNNILSESLKKYFSDNITFKFLEFTADGTPKDVFKLLVDGVDYSNVNTAGRIMAGVQMINFFQTQKGLRLPILIDNREAVVNKMESFDGQIIQAKAVPNIKLQINKGE